MVKVGIVGASGYTGAELIRILANHPRVELAYLTANKYAGQEVASLYPHLAVSTNQSFIAYDEKKAKDADIIFVALPHGTSMKIIPDLWGFGGKIIDLSGDFRLKDPELYRKWYGIPHTAPSLLGKAVYGLPELYRDQIKKADFITNPGCYPTSALLAVAPLLKAGLVADDPLIINSCSGLSGAGRGLSLTTHFSECNESVEAYSVGVHKHTPEMEQEMSVFRKKDVVITFVPHLVPVSRGILTTAYCTLSGNWETGKLVGLYEDFYRTSAFIKVLNEDSYPKTKHVLGSNYCYLTIRMDVRTGKAIIVAVIDNLVKGASGQAVQNMNIMCGLAEEEGLRNIGLAP